MIVPLLVEGHVVGAVGFHAMRAERTGLRRSSIGSTVIASVFDQVLARRQREETLRAQPRPRCSA